MMRQVIVTENKSDCNIAKEYEFNSIFLNDLVASDGNTEILKEEADIFYLLFGSNENQSSKSELLNLAESMFRKGIDTEIIILQNSLKDYISQNGKEALIQVLEGGLDFVEYIIDGIKDLSEKQRDRILRTKIFPLLCEVDNLKLEHYLSFMKSKFKLNARWIEALRGTIKAYREEHEKQKMLDNIENPETYEITEAEKEEAIKYLKCNNSYYGEQILSIRDFFF